MVAGQFCDRVGFTGNQGFIDFTGTRDDDRIRTDLIARVELQNVVHDNMGDAHVPQFAFPNYMGFWRRDQGKLVDRLFCGDFLQGADHRVAQCNP